jgi:hypothetical protein
VALYSVRRSFSPRTHSLFAAYTVCTEVCLTVLKWKQLSDVQLTRFPFRIWERRNSSLCVSAFKLHLQIFKTKQNLAIYLSSDYGSSLGMCSFEEYFCLRWFRPQRISLVATLMEFDLFCAVEACKSKQDCLGNQWLVWFQFFRMRNWFNT